ncbi:SDR family oxidoreductase [Curtobacterium sp. MCBD17_040]|uniref:SDR family NAD(P)-dependent oxidoreductase n=1 Tax=Curtobacterium sp. MCBD17_040 TaxID=2175674 RepID=UPI0021ABB102|nr:SDR family oxidoreductase [Curtobacterium sp. MCBD17_040]WIB65933.1 SDR family oxidoreductase [Curtobacterium sp. MCBD17_040]
MTFNLITQTILITGASSGIGRQLAVDLAARGASLVLVARRRDRLEQLAADLRRDHHASVEVIAADLSSPTASPDLRAAVEERGIRITGLVNNAGFGTFGPFADEDPERLEAELALDVMAPVRLTSAFLPDLLAAERGLLINVASMAAYSPSPRMAVYGAAKAFVLSFTESLWAELRGTGVTVFALSPGATSTEFNSVVGTDDATAGASPRSAEDVVATALAHLNSRDPGPSVIDGGVNRFAAGAMRLLSRRRTVALMHRVTDPARRR